MHPKVKFKISKTKDIATFFNFLEEAEYEAGRNIRWAILKKYPYFKKFKSDNTLKITKKEVNEFINNIYIKKVVVLKQILAYIKKIGKK